MSTRAAGLCRSSIGRGAVLAFVLAATALAAAACGGSPSASVASLNASTTTTTTAATPSSAGNSGPGQSGAGNSGSQSQATLGGVTVQFAQCMRTHGVPNFPDPNAQGQVTFSGVGPQSASFQAAQRACAKYSPNGGKAPSPAQQAKMVAQALKFSECMRAHGISDFPDPEVQSGAGGVSIGIRINGKGQTSDLNPRSPQFQAAQKVCQPLMGAPGTTRSSAVAG
jgi:hypothetical protein